MSDVNLYLLVATAFMVAVVHITGKRCVLAEKECKRYRERSRCLARKAKRRGRELRARDVAAQRKKAVQQAAPALTWDDVEALASSR